MTLFCKILSRRLLQSSLIGYNKRFNFQVGRFSTEATEATEATGTKSKLKSALKYALAGVPFGALAGVGYYYYAVKERDSPNPVEIETFEKSTIPHTLLESKPNVQVSRTIKGVRDDFNLQLVLFQYPTCPFCCKVRAFLDYYGLPYEVVEVNPVLRQQTKWTKYKKVPILLAKVDGGYQQLNDSTMIISALKTFLMKKDGDLKEIVDYYPMVEMKNEKGEISTEIINKYFLMYEEKLPKSKTTEIVKEEKNWREWADNSLVHTLSPNVYRTFDEALAAFKWFSEVGEWDRLFSPVERNIVVYVGAFAMWIISKRLKKRHRLLEDERESLYQECRKWMKPIIKKNTTFMGGSSPNLADLAVYGVLSSIEGCAAFKDLLEHTKIGNWYYPMKEIVNNHGGKKEVILA